MARRAAPVHTVSIAELKRLQRPALIGAWLAVTLELVTVIRRMPRWFTVSAAGVIVFVGAMLVAAVLTYWRPLVIFAIAYLLIRYGSRAQRWNARRRAAAAQYARDEAEAAELLSSDDGSFDWFARKGPHQ